MHQGSVGIEIAIDATSLAKRDMNVDSCHELKIIFLQNYIFSIEWANKYVKKQCLLTLGNVFMSM